MCNNNAKSFSQNNKTINLFEFVRKVFEYFFRFIVDEYCSSVQGYMTANGGEISRHLSGTSMGNSHILSSSSSKKHFAFNFGVNVGKREFVCCRGVATEFVHSARQPNKTAHK